ncbi:hypothetical protein [Shouchella lehensis]|uniref:hypothetical protein n=1 Tax=Shouchella lehensis TaxID=300825 RepID=UPI0018CF8412|nr:hypothetical protein [Shouchella lehensis]
MKWNKKGDHLFSPTDWLRLFMAALFILPIVTVIRESGYYLAASLLRGENKKLIIGSGPTLIKLRTVEVRRYFFMYSWMEYDELKPGNRFWHGFIYAAPIITTGTFAFLVNSLVLGSVLPPNIFWTTFIFYCFYYMLFDVIPVYLPDGQPTNGRAIFDLIWHGERSDFKKLREENELKTEENNERSNTEAQEETMENRDRDDEERDDHTNPESSGTRDNTDSDSNNERSFTESQEQTKENRDRDERARGNYAEPDA